MIKIFITTILLSLTAAIAAQEEAPAVTTNTWKTLAKITYKKEYDEILGFKIDKPVFSDKVKSLEGEIVEVKGYIIPVEGYKSHKEFILLGFRF